MSALGLLALLLPLGTGSGTEPNPGPTSGSHPVLRGDEVEDLVEWVDRAQRGRAKYEAETIEALREHLNRLDQAPEPSTEEFDASHRALLDLMGLALDPPRGMPEAFGTDAARLGRRALESEFRFESRRGPLLAWLRDSILVGGIDQPRPRRLAAVALLRGRQEPSTRLALLHLARSGEPDLRQAAFEALAGWRDDDVNDLFLDALAETPSEGLTGTWLWDLLGQHLMDLGSPLEGDAAERLADQVVPLTVAEDWRTAIAAVRLLPALPSSAAVPRSIEALTLWQRRQEQDGDGSLRLEHALADELRRRAGRSLGLDPRRWALWWERVQSGELAPIADWGDNGDDSRATTATFFGLRPRSDRVIFVIDCSTSMSRPTSYRSERTRYEEAEEQLARFLTAVGERARFGIALFSDKGRRWRSRLQAATPRTIGEARRWLSANGPDGGTYLAEGLDKALDLRPGRPLDASRVEADTIVVLCDGATHEDAAWARRWLELHNQDAELVFHCVQIGGSSAGALEALAKGSNGTFVRVDG